MNFEIEAVEYPVDEYPVRNIMFDYNEGKPNFLRLLVDDEPESEELVGVWWNGPHTCNDTVSTIPKKHDYVISLGCEGYALLLRGVQEANNVIADMASLRTLIDVDLDFTGATAALGFSAATLAPITTATTGDIALAVAVWTDEVKHIRTDGTEHDAAEYLTDGKARLNKFNKGREVPQQYAQYAERALDMAKLWADKRKDFLSQIEKRVQAAGASTAAAAQWIAEQNVIVLAAQQYVGNITQGVLATQMYRQDGLERIGRFQAELKKLEQITHSKQKSQILMSTPWEPD
jgi:hypothetical protein